MQEQCDHPMPDSHPSGQDYAGPCRQTSHSMLKQQIAELRRKADGLEAIMQTIGEVGSPAEEALWHLLCNSRPNY